MNTKHPLWKEKLKLEREIYELYQIQRKNTRLVPLDRPYKHGYYKTYDLRADIKRRDDAWVFEAIAKLTTERIFSRDKKFRIKYKKGRYEVRRPARRYISEKIYLSLAPQLKKYFRLTDHFDKDYNPYRKEYAATVPEYYFVEKITPRWITHEMVCDVDVRGDITERELALNKDKFYEIWNFRRSAPGWYCNFYNRADRAHNKRVLKQAINGKEAEFRYQHRNAATWFWW